jgi:radical SAM superfamily enzyme YgiQ (UPF0313 family)
MNILLLYPKHPDDTFWSFKHALNILNTKAVYPPLGLLTVAAMLPGEWNKKLIDMNVEELFDDEVMKADMVFISAMSVQSKSTVEAIKKCKRFNKTIVAGGPLFLSREQEFDDVDHLILGEAEITLPAFLKDLKERKAKRIYSSDEYPDLSTTPLPMWSLINFKNYSTMPLQSSRGCPFDCEFCEIVVMNGRVPRTKSPEQMLQEIKSLHHAGWRGRIFIVDDNFIGNKPNATNILTLLAKWQKQNKYPFTIQIQASIDLANNFELMKKMREANFNQVFVGIETPNPDGLKECDKRQNSRTNLEESIKIINRNGLQVTAGFIVGFDSDPKNIFDLQINFIQKTGIVIAMVGVLNALPGTRLWKRLKGENRVVGNTSGDNTNSETNIIPIMGMAELRSGYKKILDEIYSKKNYYKRMTTFLKNYNPSAVPRITKTDVITLMKTIWKMGIFSNGERILFWKLVIKTFFWKMRAFPDIIACIILGFHFHIITKKS